MLEIEFDAGKREATLITRGLDFAEAGLVFAGMHFTALDDRADYGEKRFITMGFLHDREVVVVWTYRPNAQTPTHRRIISMRKANERECKKFKHALRR